MIGLRFAKSVLSTFEAVSRRLERDSFRIRSNMPFSVVERVLLTCFARPGKNPLIEPG